MFHILAEKSCNHIFFYFYVLFRHRCQRGGKYKTKSKGIRNRGASLKVQCKCYVGTLENPTTKEVIISGLRLDHTLPCNPSPAQQMVGRVKSGRNFKSIPWLVLQRAAALIDCKASTQTLRMALHRDPDFPRIITTDSTFMRNFRLYIKMKGITGPKPTTTTAHGGAVDFEEIMYVPNHCLVVDQLQQTSFLYFIFCFTKAADQSTH